MIRLHAGTMQDSTPAEFAWTTTRKHMIHISIKMALTLTFVLTRISTEQIRHLDPPLV